METQRHNFNLGEIVTVFNRTVGGKYIIEGRAAIRKIRPSEDMYDVIFLSEKRGSIPRARYVDPNGQDSPQAYLELLNAQNFPRTEVQ